MTGRLDRGHKMLEEALAEFGYQPEPERVNRASGDDTDSPYAQLNDAAMKDLSAWVPDLATDKSTPGISKLRSQSGRYRSYVGVATWRVGPDGPPIEQWDCNLKIVSTGINDFASGEKFTPINLVMKA